MSNSKLLEQFETPILASYDVIVCGGGIAGVAAAVAAKRAGVNVLLLEKSVMLGGMATLGLISFYEPLCDGKGHKLIYGISDELLHLSMKYGPDTLAECWRDDPDHADTEGQKTRYETLYSPTIYTLALDEWVLSAGVDVMFDTVVVAPVKESGRITGVIVENKSGRAAYMAKMLVDVTGDADILYRAGVPCANGINYIVYTSYPATLEDCANAAASRNIMKARQWVNVGADYLGGGHPEGMPVYEGISADIVTDFVLTGRRMLLERLKQTPRFERDVAIIPGMPQLRQTRRIAGEYEIREEDFGKHFGDSIGIGADFSKPGYPFEIPYRILHNHNCGSILTAGRSVSCDGWAWNCLRAIPIAAVTGQAAGTAAALCAMENITAGELKITELQETLRNAGVRLHLEIR
jgi:hypothetical protein